MKISWAVGALCASFAASAHATTIESYDLRELTEASDAVIVGTVVSSASLYDELGRIVSDAEVRIEDPVAGSVGSTILIRTLGGVVGDLQLTVPGEPILREGERLIAFLRRSDSEDVFRPVGMSQGVFRISTHRGIEVVEPGGTGLSLVERTPEGRLRPAAPAIRSAQPVDQFLPLVRELARERTHVH